MTHSAGLEDSQFLSTDVVPLSSPGVDACSGSVTASDHSSGHTGSWSGLPAGRVGSRNAPGCPEVQFWAMSHCLGIWETTGVNRPSWPATGQNKTFFFFLPWPNRETRSKIGSSWHAAPGSLILFHSVTNCSLRTYYASHTLTKECNGIIPFFDAYKPGAAKLRHAKQQHFISFSIIISILFQAHTNTVIEIRSPLTCLPWVASNSRRLKKYQGV